MFVLCKSPQHQPPDGKKKKKMRRDKEREKQKGMPLICEGYQMGEGCLRADMSWHVPSFISSLLSVLCLTVSLSARLDAETKLNQTEKKDLYSWILTFW